MQVHPHCLYDKQERPNVDVWICTYVRGYTKYDCNANVLISEDISIMLGTQSRTKNEKGWLPLFTLRTYQGTGDILALCVRPSSGQIISGAITPTPIGEVLATEIHLPGLGFIQNANISPALLCLDCGQEHLDHLFASEMTDYASTSQSTITSAKVVCAACM